MTIRLSPKRSLLTVAALTAVLAVASCSSGSDDSDSSGDAGAGADMSIAEPEDVAQDRGSLSYLAEDSPEKANAAGSAPGESPSAALPGQLGTAMIKTATVKIAADDVSKVVDDIYLVAAQTRGAVTGESTSTDSKGVADQSRLEVKVPVAKFDPALDEIKQLGTSADTNKQEDDVTAEVADVASRVKSAERSIAQLRQLFNRGTKLGDVITLERELSQRQADLEALQAQQRALAAQTTLSTITVSVHLNDDDAAPTDDEDQAGFVAGIKQGWDAFVTFVIGLSHAVGLLLPLGLLAAALGWLAWVLVRRFRGPHSMGASAD